MDGTRRNPAELRRPLGVRMLAWVLVLLGLVAQVSDLVHFLLVEHTICAAHGELIHGSGHDHGEEAGAPDPLTTFDETQREAEGSTWARSGVSDDDHEHCAVRSDRRETWTPPAGPSCVAVVAWTRSSPVANSASADSATAIPLLFLAPKNSPPRRA